MSGLLLVAATERELCGHDGLVCGVGPVDAAAATARALAVASPAAVLHIGIAGAHGLPLRSVVVGTESLYADLACAIPVVDAVLPDAALLAAVREALPDAAARPITTSATVGRTTGAAVEAMEGFGVLRACALAGVQAVELRVVSNAIGEADRSKWDFDGAFATLAEALDVLVPALSA